MIFYTRPWLKALSAISANLSAGFFGVIVIAPNLFPLKALVDFGVLILDIAGGTSFLLFTVKLEDLLEV